MRIFTRMVLLIYDDWLMPCEKKKHFVPSIWYLVPTTYYFVPTRKIFCSHNIVFCSHNISYCSLMLFYFVPTKYYCVTSIYYFILFPQNIILLPQYIILTSVIRMSVSPSLTFHSKTFSETMGPIRTKLGHHSPWVVPL